MAAITERFGSGGANLVPGGAAGVPNLASALRDVADDLAALQPTPVTTPDAGAAYGANEQHGCVFRKSAILACISCALPDELASFAGQAHEAARTERSSACSRSRLRVSFSRTISEYSVCSTPQRSPPPALAGEHVATWRRRARPA